MEQNKRQQVTRRIPWIKVLLVAIFISLQAQLWVGEGSLGELKRIKVSLQAQQAENTRLVARNAQLQALVAQLRASSEALEGRARSELDLVHPGETLYRIVKKEKAKDDDNQP